MWATRRCGLPASFRIETKRVGQRALRVSGFRRCFALSFVRRTAPAERFVCRPTQTLSGCRVLDVVGLQGPWSCRLPASATLHPLLVRPYEFASILRPLLHRLAWT